MIRMLKLSIGTYQDNCTNHFILDFFFMISIVNQCIELITKNLHLRINLKNVVSDLFLIGATSVLF